MLSKDRALTNALSSPHCRLTAMSVRQCHQTAEARAIAMMVQEYGASIRHRPTPLWKVCSLHACPSCRLCYEACP